MTLTITEALAEIKTIGKRLASKRSGIMGYLAHQEGVKDPLEKEGGSVEHVRRERQAIDDLEERIVKLRAGIRNANEHTTITVEGTTRSIHDWLTWRREIASGHRAHLEQIRQTIMGIRANAHKAQAQVIPPGGVAAAPVDYHIHVDEAALLKELESVDIILSTLDGQLSLKNATTSVFVAD